MGQMPFLSANQQNQTIKANILHAPNSYKTKILMCHYRR